jgi:hypothetical protein
MDIHITLDSLLCNVITAVHIRTQSTDFTLSYCKRKRDFEKVILF